MPGEINEATKRWRATQGAKIRAELEEENPDALLADGFDHALIGVARRSGQPTLAVYDTDRALRYLMYEGMSHTEAQEHLDFNVTGAWMGDHTPVWLQTFDGRW